MRRLPRPASCLRRPVRLLAGVAVLLAASGVAGGGVWLQQPSGVVQEAPGPVVDLGAHTRGPHPAGRLLLTTVRSASLSRFQALRQGYSWGQVASAPPSVQASPVAFAEFDASEGTAVALARSLAAGIDPAAHPVVPAGALVVSVASGSAAADAGLQGGDVISSAAGRPVSGATALAGMFPASGPLALTVTDTEGKRRGVTLSRAQAAGLTLVDAWPAATSPAVDVTGVGSTSGGLVMTLAFYDALSGGDLTGGAVIAGTGTVTTTGAVEPVAGVDAKTRAAVAAGASVMLVPAGEEVQARGAAAGRLTIVAVSTVSDAIRWLCADGGHAPACANRDLTRQS